MTPEEIKAMQDENAKLKADLDAKAAEIATRDTRITELNVLVEQKNQDIVGARKKYQKLSELPKEEVEAMTEQERKLKEDQDAIHEQQEQALKQQQEDRKRDIESRKNELARKMVGDNPDLQKKFLENFDRIKDSDKAYSVEEIASFGETAFNMLGEARPDPIRNAVNGAGNGGAPGAQDGGGFADTDAGKQLAQALNLPVPPADGGGAK